MLIIGSGPAGYTAAIYASRSGLKPVLYKGIQPGGQLSITNDVENYPGFPKGITGPDMMQLFEEQAVRFGTDVREGAISSVDFSSHPLSAKTEEGEELTAEVVIISTGASAKWLGLASEKRLNGKGVSACAVCDGFFFRGKEVAVVGGGDTACEEASHLAKLCKKVYVLVRKDHMRASAIMQQRVRGLDNVEILFQRRVKEVLGGEAVEGLLVERGDTGKSDDLRVQGLFVAIGHEPNTGMFSPWLELDQKGYIKTLPGSSKTNVEGVFATGDAQDPVYRQAVTAAGSGCMGALDAERFLSEARLKSDCRPS